MRKQLKTAIRTLTPYEKLMMAREVMWSMQQMKQHQIDSEPEEEIWKDHMWQLIGADELLMLDEESWNNGYEKEITINEMIDVENGNGE